MVDNAREKYKTIDTGNQEIHGTAQNTSTHEHAGDIVIVVPLLMPSRFGGGVAERGRGVGGGHVRQRGLQRQERRGHRRGHGTPA